MSTSVVIRRPLLALGDSRPLFSAASPLDEAMASFGVPPAELRACYIGASNGDQPEFYEIFEAAMTMKGMLKESCCFVRTCGSIRWLNMHKVETAALEAAHIIVLAGGDTAGGMAKMREVGVDKLLTSRFNDGTALLIGISAGGEQFCHKIYQDSPEGGTVCEGLGFLPPNLTIGMHEESEDWVPLRQATELLAANEGGREEVLGVGVPAGGGVWFDTDGSEGGSGGGGGEEERVDLRACDAHEACRALPGGPCKLWGAVRFRVAGNKDVVVVASGRPPAAVT